MIQNLLTKLINSESPASKHGRGTFIMHVEPICCPMEGVVFNFHHVLPNTLPRVNTGVLIPEYYNSPILGTLYPTLMVTVPP